MAIDVSIPCFFPQALDEEYLKVDAQFGGIDQRKIFTFAEKVSVHSPFTLLGCAAELDQLYMHWSSAHWVVAVLVRANTGVTEPALSASAAHTPLVPTPRKVLCWIRFRPVPTSQDYSLLEHLVCTQVL